MVPVRQGNFSSMQSYFVLACCCKKGAIWKHKHNTTQKMKFFIKGFFSKCDQIRRKLRIWSYFLKKFLMETLFFVQVYWFFLELERDCSIRTFWKSFMGVKALHKYFQWVFSFLSYEINSIGYIDRDVKEHLKDFQEIYARVTFLSTNFFIKRSQL